MPKRKCFIWPLRLDVLQAGPLVVPYTSQADLQSASSAYQGFSNPPVDSVEQLISARELAEIIKVSRKYRLPELKLGQFDGNALSWHKWMGKFTSTIDPALPSDEEKLTYLETLVTGKAKAVVAEYSYSGVL